MTANVAENQPILSIAGIAMRAVVFAGLWWTLTEGAVDSWLVGIPTVIAATVASSLLSTAPGRRWRLVGAIQFVVFFAVESLRAGVDVARRAVTLDIEPQIITYESSIESEVALTLFCGFVTSLPGTLTTEMDDGILHVHTLDSRRPVVAELRRLEHHIAAMLGERIQSHEEV